MSNYSQITSFAPKDLLATGNPSKVIRGSEIDPELAAIAVAIASKLDTSALATNVGTEAITIATTLPTASTIGFRGIPINAQTSNYTCVLTDAGKAIVHSDDAGAGDTFTIPSNASVAYGIGTVLTFINLDSNNLSIAITTDTLVLAGSSSTGTRTLGENGIATAIKMTSTVWLISGVRLT